MFELARKSHPQFFHHSNRPYIRRHGECDDFVEADPRESEVDCRSRGFGGVAAAPVFAR
jgi:hypothetical protein